MRGTLAMMLLASILIANKCRVTESFGLDMIGNIQTTANFFNDAFGVMKGDLPITALLTGSTGPMLDKILDSVGDISGKIDDLSASFTDELKASDMRNAKRFQAVQTAIERVMTEIPKKGKLNEDMREFRSYATRVNSLYKEFEHYSKNKTHFNERTINYFIDAIISRDRGGLSDILQQMFTLVIQEDWYYTQGIMELYADSIRKTDTAKLCGVGLSPQGRYYKMYETIYMAEARGFMMQMFAYSVKSAYSRTSYIEELDLSKTLMLGRLEKYFLAAMNQMRGLQQAIELCDAPKYRPNIDYVTTGAPQGLSFNLSLIRKTSNIAENMVVSGVRFVKNSEGMIDYQIKEAKLMAQGQVAPNGTWQELPKMNKEKLTLYTDYYVIKKNDLFDIDDITLGSGSVVVGVGFELIQAYNVLFICIYQMEFDVSTGQLKPGSQKWANPSVMANTPPYNQRARIVKKTSKGNPTEASGNVIDTELKEGLYFDYIQSGYTVPFFDARPVEMSLPNFALSGIGIYHRGAEGYGGFLNFRLIHIDLAEYMQQHDTLKATDNP